MSTEQHEDAAVETQPVCQYCGTPITKAPVLCERCETPHHGDCFAENGGCTVYGCNSSAYAVAGRTGVVSKTREDELPFSVELFYWADNVLPFTVLAFFPWLLFAAATRFGRASDIALYGLVALVVAPFVLYFSQFVITKTYQFSTARNRLEICWSFLRLPVFRYGLMSGKAITGMSYESLPNNVDSGYRYRLLFHRKTTEPFSIYVKTNDNSTKVSKGVETLRDILAAPAIKAPTGFLIRYLSETYLWCISIAIELTGLFIVTMLISALALFLPH